jgi:hypothetical protein
MKIHFEIVWLSQLLPSSSGLPLFMYKVPFFIQIPVKCPQDNTEIPRTFHTSEPHLYPGTGLGPLLQARLVSFCLTSKQSQIEHKRLKMHEHCGLSCGDELISCRDCSRLTASLNVSGPQGPERLSVLLWSFLFSNNSLTASLGKLEKRLHD